MKLYAAFLAVLTCVVGQIEPDVTPMDYTHDGVELQGYFAKPAATSTGASSPAVLFVPDWNGVNLYEQQRATMIATELGWPSFAVDIYGKDLHNVENITERRALANMYRSDPSLFSRRIQAAVNFVKGMSDIDPDKIAIVGFCFGGTGVLMYALEGLNDVAAIVSIHGGLAQVPEPSVNVTSKILVLSGGEDDESTEIIDLEQKLDATNAKWEITRYSGISHAWTVFSDDRYNAWADMRTWDSMIHFLKECFGELTFEIVEPEEVSVEAVPYQDVDGQELQGYLALPDETIWERPAPAVVIIPDWDGVNMYEQQRATLLASYGYAAFAADIYGADLQTDLTFEQRRELTTLYRNNQTLFTQRMARAVEEVKMHDSVDGDNIAMIGYCFGGTGVIYYAFSGRDDVQLVASYHGGLRTLPPVNGNIIPYTLVLSGGADDAHGNQTVLEEALNMGNSKWEISRWSGVEHGFTAWESRAYNLNADARSWEQMLSAMEELMNTPVRKETTTETEDPTEDPAEDPPSGTSVSAEPEGLTSAAAFPFTMSVLFTVAIVATLT